METTTPPGWFGYLGPCDQHRPDKPPLTEAEIWDDADEPCPDCDDRLAADFASFDHHQANSTH